MTDKMIIKPLRKQFLDNSFALIDAEVKKKKIVFSQKEAICDDLYD